MQIIKRIISRLSIPSKILESILFRVAPYLTDEKFVKLKWQLKMNYSLNLDTPQTFNEKLQWLKINDRKPEYTKMVDKYEAKKYVASIIGEEHIIPTLAVYDKVEDIEFDALPDQFVLKCTHDSGGVIICKDKSKLDRGATLKILARAQKRNYYFYTREWPYKDVRPRIIAEKYMSDNGAELEDYKVHNFNGIPKVILVCKDRFSEFGLTEDFYTTGWEHIDVSRPGHPNAKTLEPCPPQLKQMLELSEKLSKDIPFVRTDFYTINGKIYFGEITFYPASGTVPFIPQTFDEQLGSWLKLPINDQRGEVNC